MSALIRAAPVTGVAGDPGDRRVLPTPRTIAPPAVASLAGTRNTYRALGQILLHTSPVVWAYIDVVIIGVATWVAYELLVFGNPSFQWVVNPGVSGAVFCGSVTIAGLIVGLYERQTTEARSRLLLRSALALALGVALAYALLSVLMYQAMSRWIGVCVVVFYACVAVPLRLLANSVIVSVDVKLLFIGSGRSVQKAVSLLHKPTRVHYKVIGHLTPAETRLLRRRASDHVLSNGAPAPPVTPELSTDDDPSFVGRCRCLGELDKLTWLLETHVVDQVIVDADLVNDPGVAQAILACLDHGCRVIDQPTFVERLSGQVPAEHISAQWFLLADLQSASGYQAAKRLVDVGCAVVGLLLTLPLWPLIALAIRWDSRGPAFFGQKRVGLHGREFTIYKFRTMRNDAEKHGAQWATKNDARVTRVGRFLRSSRLDELPQLWNILRGDMSLVGPRPERPEFVEQLAGELPHYRQRHLIKPGLTGWAQISYGYGASVADAYQKLCYDLYYLRHCSLDLDFGIIIRTIGRFVIGAR